MTRLAPLPDLRRGVARVPWFAWPVGVAVVLGIWRAQDHALPPNTWFPPRLLALLLVAAAASSVSRARRSKG